MTTTQETRLREALATIGTYVDKKKPKTLEEANHMLDVVSVIAVETVRESRNG